MARATKGNSIFSVPNISSLLWPKYGLVQESTPSFFFLENKFQIPNNWLENQLLKHNPLLMGELNKEKFSFQRIWYNWKQIHLSSPVFFFLFESVKNFIALTSWHPYSLVCPFHTTHDRLIAAPDIHKEVHLQQYIKRQPGGHSIIENRWHHSSP